MAPDVTLIITGGLRHEGDFAKALALGADGIAVSNAALQAIGLPFSLVISSASSSVLSIMISKRNNFV